MFVKNNISGQYIDYDMLLTETTASDSPICLAGERQKPEFVSQGKLNMELVLEKFVQHFHDIYGDKTERLIKNDGRKLFLLYLRPIINGIGNYYIEAHSFLWVGIRKPPG